MLEGMQKMMSCMTKPENIPGMMQTMMPRCVSTVFSEPAPKACTSLASALPERLTNTLNSQIDCNKNVCTT